MGKERKNTFEKTVLETNFIAATFSEQMKPVVTVEDEFFSRVKLKYYHILEDSDAGRKTKCLKIK